MQVWIQVERSLYIVTGNCPCSEDDWWPHDCPNESKFGAQSKVGPGKCRYRSGHDSQYTRDEEGFEMITTLPRSVAPTRSTVSLPLPSGISSGERDQPSNEDDPQSDYQRSKIPRAVARSDPTVYTRGPSPTQSPVKISWSCWVWWHGSHSVSRFDSRFDPPFDNGTMWWAWSPTPSSPACGPLCRPHAWHVQLSWRYTIFRRGFPVWRTIPLNTHQDRRSVTQSGPRVYSFDIDPRLQLAKVVLDYRYCDLENPADLSNPLSTLLSVSEPRHPATPVPVKAALDLVRTPRRRI